MQPYCFNHFDAVLYINLPGRHDRELKLLQELERAQTDPGRIHRIEGVYDPFYGDRGCAKAHLKALQFAKESGCQRVLILEDDIYLRKSPSEMNQLICHFFDSVDQWDVFLLGSNILKHEKTQWNDIFKVGLATAAQAYCVSGHYLDELITLLSCVVHVMGDHLFPHEPIAFDCSWNNLIMRDYWYCSHIHIHQRPGYSDISTQLRERHHKQYLS